MNRLSARQAGAIVGAWIISLASFTTLAPFANADVYPNPSIAENARTPRAFGKKRALYYVVHDDNDLFTPAEWTTRVTSIRTKELSTREFFAENSGGEFDIYYDPIIVDAPIPLNADGTRPSNWYTLANNIATGTYGLNLSNYYMFAYDVVDTTSDPDQGWAGLSTSNRIYLQSTTQRVINHEIGHQTGADHAKAIRQLSDANYHPYYWDKGSASYKAYVPGVSPYVAVPFGAPTYEYGNPIDTMGSGTGQFRIREKLEDLGWLDESQVPDLNDLGPGTFKIYAHDQLQSVTDPQGNFGVVKGYDPNVFYGLTYDRPAQQFSKTLGKFLPTTQTIDLEYRAGTNGVAFYLDGQIVDLDPAGGTTSSSALRLLKVGQSIEDPDFGMSTYLVAAGAINQVPTGEDFLDYNPPPPSLLTADWFHFAILGTGSDAIGSYIQLSITSASSLNGLDGDLNQNGLVDMTDVQFFVSGWLHDTSILDTHGKYLSGDMNFDGATNLSDVYLFHKAWLAAGNAAINLQAMLHGVPEPSSLLLLLPAVALIAIHRKRNGEGGMRSGEETAAQTNQLSTRSPFPTPHSPFAFLAIACGLATTLAATQADAKLVSHFSFDASTRNGQIYANLVPGALQATGQSSSSTLPINIADGAIGQAVRFDGATNYLNATTLAMPRSTVAMASGSIAFWVRSSSETQQQAIMGEVNSGTNTAFSVDFGESSVDDFRVYVRAQGGAVAGPNTENPLTGWNDGEWHHIAATWSNSIVTNNAVYFDGVPVSAAQTVSPGALYSSYQYSMMIGALNSRGTPTRHLDGDLDDLRIYDNAIDLETVLGLTGNPVPTLNVDRATGALTLVNTTNGPLTMLGYSIQSPGNKLNQAAWTSIADHYDADLAGPNQVDPDDSWLKLSDPSSHSDLSEANLIDAGNGATLAVGQSVSLGVGTWTPSALEDLKMTIVRADGSTLPVLESYVGVISNADFNSNGVVDGADFLAWQRGTGIAVGATRAQGDANSDGAVNALDLNAWKQQFGNATPAIAAVPEPATACLLLAPCLALSPGLRPGAGCRADRHRRA
ncbi:LamG-like jellyroll fold domain-containing protein [Lacipirellula sp.]|uniref:LamG-like jellyroll fold domain-containing protein n=1 Tax=Lacipirellula sp. TaxID=2691419 RepID=UPI003D0CBD8F